MWFIGVEVEQETSAPPSKKILDPPCIPYLYDTDTSGHLCKADTWVCPFGVRI